MDSSKIKQSTGLALVLILVAGCRSAPTTEVNTSPPEAPTLTSIPFQPTISDTFSSPTPTFEAPTPVTLELWSNAWGLEESIPDKYSCHGEDISPPLSWSEPPSGTQSFVLIMTDPDANEVAGFTWDHWLVFNIPADTRSLPEGIPDEAELADGSRHGITSFDTLGYGGPCPPAGRNHGYEFRLYAIDIVIDLEPGATKSEIVTAIQGHILGRVMMTWEYPGE